jgi:pimeloyl-ACP methyl ester carboxylesterase
MPMVPHRAAATVIGLKNGARLGYAFHNPLLGEYYDLPTKGCQTPKPEGSRLHRSADQGVENPNPQRCRPVCFPVVVLVLIVYAALAASPHQGRIAIQGDRRLYLVCCGTGSATVVLEAGLRSRGDNWSREDLVPPKAVPVMEAVRKFTRVCAYDRPGTLIGPKPQDFRRSAPVSMPRSAAAGVRDLHDLLSAAHVPGPYVLVGHSFGGLMTPLYASTYRRSTVGLVLVEALLPQLRAKMTASQWRSYAALNARPLPGIHYENAELMDFSASIEEVQRASVGAALRTLPVATLTKGKPFDVVGLPISQQNAEMLDAAWLRAQRQFANSVPNATFVIVAASHNIMVERPEVVVNAIRQVVAAARTR